MQPLFIGGHPAIDFLNTVYGAPGSRREVLEDGQALLEWLVGAGLLAADAASNLKRRVATKALDRVAADARDLREWAREWLARWRNADSVGYTAESAHLNALLARGSYYRQLQSTDSALMLVEHPRIDSAESLLVLLAEQLAHLVDHEEAGLIKQCAGHDCTLSFIDRTKAHRRMFCSAQGCGNRAKVTAFRERQRGR